MYTPTFRTNQANVPILSKDEIDAIGERLVADFCPQAVESPMEIDIDRFITRYLGMNQDFQYLTNCGVFLGMTIFKDTDRVIVYNPQQKRAEYIYVRARTVIIDNSLLEDKQEHRYRFTAGHEAAHGILHAGYFANNPNQLSLVGSDYVPMVQCRIDNAKTCQKPVTQSTDKDWMEWQANRLSSAILMPKSMVLKAAHEAENASPVANAALEAVVRIFNVSNEAAHYRLKELGFVPGMNRAILPF